MADIGVPRRIAGLDGVRALAAALVVLYHVAGFFPPANPVVRQIANSGWVGVDVFFTISGFILFLPLARRAHGGRRVDLRRYAASRARRILPAYWLMLLLVVTMNHIGTYTSGHGWWVLFGNATFTATWLHVSIINPVAWTLFAEVVFYVLLPFGARIFVGRRWMWGLPLVLLAGIGHNWWLVHRTLDGRAHLTMADHPLLGARLDTIQGTFTEFAVGMSAALVWVALERRGVELRRTVALLLAFGGAALVVAMLVLLARLGDAYWTGTSAVGFLPILLSRPLLAAGSGALIIGIGYRRTWLTALFDLRPVRYLGVISYGIYLWHYPLLALLTPAIHRAGQPNKEFLEALVFTAAATLVFAAVSFHFVEKRFMGAAALRLRALGAQSSAPAVEPAPVAAEPAVPAITADEAAADSATDGPPERSR